MDCKRVRWGVIVFCILPAMVGADPRSTPSPESLIQKLAQVYASMDLDAYASLFANPRVQGEEFTFVLYEPMGKGETTWGYDEEMRIHRRMFRPESIGQGEQALAPELWVQSIDVDLVCERGFQERFDLYRSDQHPAGELDRHRWRAIDALYRTAVVWTMRNGRTLAISGHARFVLIEDLCARPDDSGRYVVYRWEDLGPGECGPSQPHCVAAAPLQSEP